MIVKSIVAYSITIVASIIGSIIIILLIPYCTCVPITVFITIKTFCFCLFYGGGGVGIVRLYFISLKECPQLWHISFASALVISTVLSYIVILSPVIIYPFPRLDLTTVNSGLIIFGCRFLVGQ